MKEFKISKMTGLTTAITVNRGVKNLERLRSFTAKAVIRILTSVMAVLRLSISDFFNSLACSHLAVMTVLQTTVFPNWRVRLQIISKLKSGLK